MSAFDVAANTLLQQARKETPAIADTLKLIIDEIKRIGNIVDPAPIVGGGKSTNVIVTPPPDVLIFTYVFTPFNLVLGWEAPSFESLFYEIRIGSSSWDTANRIIITTNLLAILDPIAVGTTTYRIKAFNSSGIYSINEKTVDVVVPAIGAVSITSTVIDNNVLLDWTEATSTFNIDYYDILKDGLVIGKQRGTFTVLFETTGGTYTYGIRAVDIAGNIGPTSSIIAEVRQPPDFDLIATGIDDLLGTKVNTMIYEDKLLANVC